MLRRIILLTQFILMGLHLLAQYPAYPKGYFRSPLDIPMGLAANFGELRPNHWHMGLDIRTDARENLPVYAAADGYIAHIGIRPQSFGRFIIINHPNGMSTLYGHLNDFNPELEQYATDQQYLKESWALDIDLSPNQFKVRKGDFIAYSGNTGGSQGPHVHFEIFDTKSDRRFNPLLFGFPLEDNVPPTLVRLGMYDRSKSVFEQSPQVYVLKNTDSGYIIPKVPVIETGLNKVSFALQMYDKMSSGGSPDGVYMAKLYLDNEVQVSFMLDSIDYNETVYVNAQIDYRLDYKGGVYLQHLSKLPGEKGVVYKKIKTDGVVELNDTAIHYISVEVKDAYANTSHLDFAIRHNDSLAALLPAYIASQKLAPNKVNEISKSDFEMHLPAGSLYDTVPAYYYRTASTAYNAVSALHQVNDGSYPVHDDLTVRIKADKTIPDEWKNKLVIVKSDKGNTIKKVVWEGNWMTAKFGDFGKFQVFADVTAPQINDSWKGDTINLSPTSRILFTPTDNFGIKKFRAELDSQWIRFTNDKSRNWIYKFDDRCQYGIHQLTVTVEDLVGNVTTKTWWFKRYPYTPPPPKKVKSKKGKKDNGKKGVASGKKMTGKTKEVKGKKKKGK
jgi:Peptidase family M23